MDDAFTRKAFVPIGGLVAKRFFVSGCMRRRLASIEPENVLATGREVDPPAGAVFRRRGKIRSARSGSFVRCGVLVATLLKNLPREGTARASQNLPPPSLQALFTRPGTRSSSNSLMVYNNVI